MKKIYKYEVTYTDTYFYEIEANNSGAALEKLGDLTKEDAISHKNIDIVTDYKGCEEPMDEDDDSDQRDFES